MSRGLCAGTAAALFLSSCIATRDRDQADPGWLFDAQREIAAREYRASENGQGLQAPNRAHNLRTYFERAGIRVHDRTAAGSPELLQLTLTGMGRGETLAPVEPGAAPVANENRVEIHRPGLVEWYVNSEAGLEQGFTLEDRPAGSGALVAELAVVGARAELSGDAVVFATGAHKLRYGNLIANDAEGDRLVAHFEVPGTDRLRIVVDDAGATYPIVIDPLLTEAADAQLESNVSFQGFGFDVASAGDVNGDGTADVVIGAHRFDTGTGDEGAVFIFHGSATGVTGTSPGSAQTQLDGDQNGALFGERVASAGDVNGDGYSDVIAGAPLYDAGQTDEGAAFLWLGGPGGIADGGVASAAAQFESNVAGAQLAPVAAADVNGDGYGDLIIGAPVYSNPEPGEGAAFVFLGSGSGIASGNPSTAAAQIQSNQSSALFGTSVAGADVNADGYGDLIAGAMWYDNGQTNEGAVFVYHGSATGIASATAATADSRIESDQTTSSAPGEHSGAFLGWSVARAGDVNGDGYGDIIVSAPAYNSGQVDEGAAFLFHGSATGIPTTSVASAAARLETDQAFATAQMFDLDYIARGYVAGAGDVNGDGYADVVLGAGYYDSGQMDEGAAFVFLGSATGVGDGNPTNAYAQLEADQAGAGFGVSAAGAGDVNGDGYGDLIVGADLYTNPSSQEGAAFIYHGGSRGIPDGDPSTAAAELQSDQSASITSVALGDVNGDGYADAIVGVPAYDAGLTDEGAAFVFLGSASGLADGTLASAATQLESNAANSQFGHSVAGAGDVNGDGYADVIVGSPGYDLGLGTEGAAFIFAGSASGIADGNPATAATDLHGNQGSVSFGIDVASAGDVNGDGYADVIVGAPFHSAGQSLEGVAFIYHGSASGVADGSPATAAGRVESNQQNSQFGYEVASAGDVNGDGYGDVSVGAIEYTSGHLLEGAVFVFHGSPSGVGNQNPATAATQILGDQDFAQFGNSVASAGDVNGDGYGDLITGFPLIATGYGSAFVFLGSASGVADGTPAGAASQLVPGQPSSFGESVSSAGDVNGDGYADVVVGGSTYGSGESGEGAAFVFLGSASGVASGDETTASAQLESNQVDAGLGARVAAGDVNGDGFSDVLVLAPQYDVGANQSAVFAFLGNSEGRAVLAHQERGNGSGMPVQPWGASYSATGFAVALSATHPHGTGRVKAELQACPSDGPPAVAFGDASCTTLLTPNWVAVNGGAPEVVLSETFSGLTNNTLYRWRARVLHASTTGAIPPNPAHGPWRRVGAQSVEADIRLPEPGLVALASGIALVSILARARPRARRERSRG